MTEDEATATMINAGIDMVMLSNPIALINRYIKHMKKHITGKRIFETRLNDAVAKILSVKLAMGLV
jgi:beta-glucosidase-like glycosyl hydrolase